MALPRADRYGLRQLLHLLTLGLRIPYLAYNAVHFASHDACQKHLNTIQAQRHGRRDSGARRGDGRRSGAIACLSWAPKDSGRLATGVNTTLDITLDRSPGVLD